MKRKRMDEGGCITSCKPISELKSEISRLKTELEEKQAIEKAKGILVRRKNISEEEATRLMLTMSLEQKKTIAELAEILILADKLLAFKRPDSFTVD